MDTFYADHLWSSVYCFQFKWLFLLFFPSLCFTISTPSTFHRGSDVTLYNVVHPRKWKCDLEFFFYFPLLNSDHLFREGTSKTKLHTIKWVSRMFGLTLASLACLYFYWNWATTTLNVLIKVPNFPNMALHTKQHDLRQWNLQRLFFIQIWFVYTLMS